MLPELSCKTVHWEAYACSQRPEMPNYFRQACATLPALGHAQITSAQCLSGRRLQPALMFAEGQLQQVFVSGIHRLRNWSCHLPDAGCHLHSQPAQAHPSRIISALRILMKQVPHASYQVVAQQSCSEANLTVPAIDFALKCHEPS